jgi:hypothetical protein
MAYLHRFWPVFLFGIVMTVLALVLPGTCDDGDSVHHYLFARYAFDHPGLFLDHWAKPLYVLVMAPFAQLGFVGVKLANVALMTSAMWCTIRIGELMGLKYAWLAGVVLGTMPELLHVTLSGLTEPLFAACLSLSVLWCFEQKYARAALLLSFLPFVRSEGLVVLGVVVPYFLLVGQWRVLPLLLLGHVAYGLTGWPILGDPLWVFRKIPYATLNGSYGKGLWDHFFASARHYWGLWQALMIVTGVLMGAWRLAGYWRGRVSFPKADLWLVYGIFLAYFGAHVVFWGLGIFNSFGMTRVMVAIDPLAALIAVLGAEWVLNRISNKPLQLAGITVFSAACLASMWDTPKFASKFMPTPAQNAQFALADRYQKMFEQQDFFLYADAVTTGYAFNYDWFGPKQNFTDGIPADKPFDQPTAVVWDYWYSVVEKQTTFDELQNDPRLKLIEVLRSQEGMPESVVALFMDTAHAAPTPLLYFQNFECAEGEHIDSDKGRFGKRSAQIYAKQEYGPTVVSLNRMSKLLGDSLLIQCDVMMADTSYEGAHMVVQYETPERDMLSWEGYSFNKQALKPNEWYAFEMVVPILKDKLQESTMTIYPWNPSEQKIWVDNLTVRYK